MKKEKRKVFISYAREDLALAEKIHQYLSDADFDPWMDVHDIVSGDKWLKSITRAIKESDYFLSCISPNSVDKPGVLQEELDIALEICKKIPDPEIFLIPVRLAECQMPERIKQYQWVDLFAEDGWVRLLRALHKERQPTRKWDWRILAALACLLLVAGFVVVRAALQPVVVDPSLYDNVCLASAEPIKVGLAALESCPADDVSAISDMWAGEAIELTPLEQSAPTSQSAQSASEYDLVIRGTCNEAETTLQFELASSRNPDEIYQPTSVQVTGSLTEVGAIGKALIRYQHGDYAEAASQFEASQLTANSPELALLLSNSLMFSGSYDEAIRALEDTVLVLDPEYAAAYNNLGMALFNKDLLQGKSGPIQSGLPELAQAIEHAFAQPDDAVKSLAYANQGDLLRRNGNWEDAEAACQAAQGASAHSSGPYICLVLFKLSRFSGSSDNVPFPEIQGDLNNAKRFDDLPAKSYYLQAALYREQNLIQEALNEYQRFLDAMHERACLEMDWKYIRDTGYYLTKLQR